MDEQRRYVKRNIDLGERLTFDQGRIYLELVERNSGTTAVFDLRQEDGGVSRKTLHVGEKLVLDGGRILIELERRYGRKARIFVNLADSVIINRPIRDIEGDPSLE